MTDIGTENVIYLDHAATSWPKPEEVRREMTHALTDLTANAGRSGHEPSVAAARMIFQTRERLAELLGVAGSENVVFVRGCTEGLNLVLKGWLRGEASASPARSMTASKTNCLWAMTSWVNIPLRISKNQSGSIGCELDPMQRRLGRAKRKNLR